jgi:hypothetical protein
LNFAASAVEGRNARLPVQVGVPELASVQKDSRRDSRIGGALLAAQLLAQRSWLRACYTNCCTAGPKLSEYVTEHLRREAGEARRRHESGEEHV